MVGEHVLNYARIVFCIAVVVAAVVVIAPFASQLFLTDTPRRGPDSDSGASKFNVVFHTLPTEERMPITRLVGLSSVCEKGKIKARCCC